MEIFNESIQTNDFSLFFLTDIHQGSALHQRDAFLKAINRIKKTTKDKNVMTILGGDIVECIIIGDPRFSPSEIDENYTLKDLKDLPRKQADAVIEDLEPIKDTIQYALIGNHCEQYIKRNAFDVYNHYCQVLGCKKLGFSSIGKISLAHHKKSLALKLALTHGTGGGGFREGYALNNAMDIFRKYDVDIHLMGHTHKLVCQDFDFMSIGNNNELKHKTKWYGVGGCFLDTYGIGNRGYFEGRKGMLSEIGFLEVWASIKSGYWKYGVKKHKFNNGEFV